MKKNRFIIFVVLLVAALLLLKYFFFPSGQDDKIQGPPGAQKNPANNVEGYIVKTSVVNNSLSVTGTVNANEMVELRPEISGKIQYISINEGQPVKEGQLLVKLVDADLVAQLKKVNAQAKLAEDRLNRQKELLNIQGVSKEEYDVSENELQSNLADAEVLKVQIGRTEIRAPFSGVIGLRNISNGSYISPQNVIATIQQINPVKIDFSVPERYAKVLKLNTDIDFTIEGSDEKFKGTVYAMEADIESSTRSLKVRARAENSKNKITPGAFAKVELLLDKIENATMVPTQAIVPILKGQQVYISDHGVAKAVTVKIGLREEKAVQVTDGIKVGDTLVTTGVMSIHNGSALKFLHVQ